MLTQLTEGAKKHEVRTFSMFRVVPREETRGAHILDVSRGSEKAGGQSWLSWRMTCT